MIRLEVWGPYALITRGEFSSERVSYEVLTPSAARGIVESLFWHEGLRWKIRKIYVLNEIKFTNIRRNEIQYKVPNQTIFRDAQKIAQGCQKELYMTTSQQISQRASMMLKDVHYVIEAEFEMTDKANPSDNPGKFQNIIKRRMRKGQAYTPPYFGCRECPAYFREWPGGPIPTISETRDLGIYLYDFDFSDPQHITPLYFHAKLENGVVNVADQEVLR